MNFDLLFLGTNALDSAAGLTTPNEDEAAIKELMVERARRVVLVADASKLGDRSFVSFAALDEVDLLVTDAAHPGRSLRHSRTPTWLSRRSAPDCPVTYNPAVDQTIQSSSRWLPSVSCGPTKRSSTPAGGINAAHPHREDRPAKRRDC